MIVESTPTKPMRVDTTPTNNLYVTTLDRAERKVARVRLSNAITAYLSVVAPELSAQDTLNVTLQSVDAVEEMLAGYPNKQHAPHP